MEPLDKLIDIDGENQAVRHFLAMYGCGQMPIHVLSMKKDLTRAGLPFWPSWVEESEPTAVLNKAEAQSWLRHLFALEDTVWRPMEFAPKDREILIEVEKRAGIPNKCLVGHYQPGGHCIEDHPPISEGWYFWNGSYFDIAAKPVRWMHLPTTQREPLAPILERHLDGLITSSNTVYYCWKQSNGGNFASALNDMDAKAQEANKLLRPVE